MPNNDFSSTLLNWYDSNARVLPFRGTKDIYRVWLSEIMLQQTTTTTVAGYYERFLNLFPDVFALANASEDAVLKAWEGLGYYSRARNLHKAAKTIAFERNGIFPQNANELRMLPGIGPYAANAIASIVYNEPVAALDGNQARVLARVEACGKIIQTPFDLEEIAMNYLSRARPGDYNQALMDLGASVCTPKKPDCANCPVNVFCRGREEAESYPRKPVPKDKREETRTILVILTPEGIVLRKRPPKGLLADMYEFPAKEDFPEYDSLRFVAALPVSKHVFTHLIWRMTGEYCVSKTVPSGCIAVRDFSEVSIPTAYRVYRNEAQKIIKKNEFNSCVFE